MRWFMPCKLGETYPETKFVDWVNDTRIFALTGRQLQLKGIDVGMEAEWCDEPEIFRGYLSYTDRDELHLESYNAGKWNFEKLVLEVDNSEFETRILGKKKCRLIGFKYDENGLLGHYITCDRYEHFYEPINIELTYKEYVGYQYIHFDFKEDTTHGRNYERWC